MALTASVSAQVAGAVALALHKYATLEVLDTDAWDIQTFAPYATDAIGFKVYNGQPLVGGKTRSEISIDSPWLEGDTVRYTWKFMIPAATTPDPSQRFWVITQWHDQPNFRLGQDWDTYQTGNSPPLVIGYGEIDGLRAITISYGAPNPVFVTPEFYIADDTWYEMDMLVRWSQSHDGSAVLKIDGTQVWAATGANMHNAYQHYWKLGQYRNGDILGTAWVWFDEINQASVASTDYTLVNYEQALSRVIPYANGCPDPTAIHHLRLAAIEFFQRTLAWRETLASVATVVDQIEYVFPRATETEIAKVLRYELDGAQETVVDGDTGREMALASASTAVAWTADRWLFSVSPTPDTADLTMVFHVALKPSFDSRAIPKPQFDQYIQHIVYGALAGVLSIPGTKYENQNVATVFRARFESAISSVAASSGRGFGRVERRARAVWF